MTRTTLGALAALVVLGAIAPAHAHIRLDVPENRYNDQKNGPCGAVDDRRTDRVTVYEPGETITVRWEETIKHPSHFRIAFSAEGTADFEDPADFNDYYTNDAVLLDEIPDRDTPGFFEAQITLPEEPCEDCTLQLMQIMYDKSLADAFYWQCADIELRAGGGGSQPGADADGGGSQPGADAGPDPRPDAGSVISPDPPDADGGCHVAGGGGFGAALAVALALFAFHLPSARTGRAG